MKDSLCKDTGERERERERKRGDRVASIALIGLMDTLLAGAREKNEQEDSNNSTTLPRDEWEK